MTLLGVKFIVHLDSFTEERNVARLDSKMEIENKIQEFRQDFGLTQQDLADAVDVTRATIIALEKGGYNPSLELAFRLANFFKVKIENIFFQKRS